jgi:hypothetical protein
MFLYSLDKLISCVFSQVVLASSVQAVSTICIPDARPAPTRQILTASCARWARTPRRWVEIRVVILAG